ncbi:hypothetical protein R1flu_005943 [Riccia fluitans]|uniref:CRAL-TRIO domain-containing protein n=1 Tax=Riccia fluitans TaxID=41844 RepID=A0ABD1YXD8_9MARC
MGSLTANVVYLGSCNFVKFELYRTESTSGRLKPASVDIRGSSLHSETMFSSLASYVTLSTKRRSRVDQSPGGKWVCNSVESKDVLLRGGEAVSEILEHLRESVKKQGGDIETADDMEMLRFLWGKSMDLEKAATAFVSHYKWKAEFIPEGGFTEADLPTELAAKKSYAIAQDKKGRPVSLTLGRNHVYNKDTAEFKRFAVYVMEKLIAEAPPGTQDFVVIIDLKGLGVKNLDTESFISGFQLLQNHYPGRIDKMYMINVPLIFSGLWKVASKFIDESTKNKIIFVQQDRKKVTDVLLESIDIDFLPIEYGGNGNLIPIQDFKKYHPPTCIVAEKGRRTEV